MSRIYFDISAAVHQRAGLGRYADSLARALLPICYGNRVWPSSTTARPASSRWPGWKRARAHRQPGLQAVADAGLAGAAAATSASTGSSPARAVPRHRAPAAAVARGADGAHRPRPDLPALPRAPQAAQPLVPQHDHAALLPPRRRHHRGVGAEQARRDRGLRHPAGEDHRDLRSRRSALLPAAAGDRGRRPGPLRSARPLSALRGHHRAAQEPGPGAGRVRAAPRRRPDRRAR